MKASVVDLRYKMNDVLKALERNEKITVLYRGKVKGTLIPVEQGKHGRMKDHPFFGMLAKNEGKSVSEEIDDLRKPRFHDI